MQKQDETDHAHLERTDSIIQRMAKYNSAVQGQVEEKDEDHEGTTAVIRESKHKEKVSFGAMTDLKTQWEGGSPSSAMKERDVEDEELAKLRQKMLLGRSESMKAVYEKACEESTRISPGKCESVNLGRDIRAILIKEKFEKGQELTEEEMEKLEKTKKEKEDDLSVFTEAETAVGARNMFKQIDTDLKKSPTSSPSKSHQNGFAQSPSSESIAKEEIVIETTEKLTEKFKYFENYKDEQKERRKFQMTPPLDDAKEKTNNPEVPNDPNLIRSSDFVEDIPVMDTAKKMLDKFRALESFSDTQSVPLGPKPLKRITPPREVNHSSQNGHQDTSDESDRDPNIVKCTYKTEEYISVEADTARMLRQKFERWEGSENGENKASDEEGYLPQIDTTKNLRAMFEAKQGESLKNLEKPKPRNSRFIEYSSGSTEKCSVCDKKLYPMEKMEASGLRFHKNCFRCVHCSCMLRLENYTTSGGKMYCNPHFKQLFISKGNYDEGFGREQHKDKWNHSQPTVPTQDLNLKNEEKEYQNGDTQHTNGEVHTNGDVQHTNGEIQHTNGDIQHVQGFDQPVMA